MKIELKNIKHSPSLSEETEAFTANLYINEVHAGYAKNNGHGGSTDYYQVDEKGRDLIREAEQYCLGLPEKQYPAAYGMEAYSLKMNLEHLIDDLLSSHLQEKENKKFDNKINKAMINGIVYGLPNESVSIVAFKIPLSQLLALPVGPDSIKNAIIKSVLPDLKPGEKIINTNIPEHILKDAGLKEDQYMEPQKTVAPKQTQKKGKSL
jgi:hypothetical protein